MCCVLVQSRGHRGALICGDLPATLRANVAMSEHSRPKLNSGPQWLEVVLLEGLIVAGDAFVEDEALDENFAVGHVFAEGFELGD